ncbi:helix-turn-helix domain-containing protein [Streptomyces sp. NPDC090029]|uniref:helix-turn-helix domain-containing protein n=1 Tax=Streptomyces sp. NPDC090029 TaxID=3365924 RepID=UPI003813B9AC
MTHVIGARIRHMRTTRGLSQAELAGSELSTSYISLIEAGKRIPSAQTLKVIAARLGCSPSDIHDAAAADTEAAIDFGLAEAEWSLADGEPTRALRQFSRARELALDAEQSDLVLQAAWGEAQCLERLHHFEDALDTYQDLLRQRSPSDTGPPTRWDIVGALCRCKVELGENDHAIEVGERALDELREAAVAPSTSGIEIMCELVRAHLSRGDISRSRHLAKAAMAEAELLQNPRQLARVYWAAGQAGQQAGRTAEAIRLTRRAVDLLTQDDNDAVLGEALALHGTTLLRDGESDAAEAQVALQRAAEIHERGRRFTEAAGCYQELARYLLVRSDHAEALRWTARALALQETGPPGDRAQALILSASALVMLGSRDEAMSCCEEAAAALKADKRGLRRLAVLWGDVAEVYIALGATEKAIDAWRRGFSLLGLMAPLPLAPSQQSDDH